MKKKIILIIIGAILLLVIVKACWPEKRELVFQTQVAAVSTVQNNVTATGNLEPVDEVEVGTQVSGIVKKLYVDYNSHVTKGQLLAELDKSTLSERLTQATNSVTSAESQLKRAQQTYNRTKELYEAKAATQVDMEDAENQLIQAKSQLLNAQTQLRESRVNLGYAEIYSPIDGVILSKDIEEGQTVASSFSTPTLFVIAKDLKNMQVEANVDEADIGQVKVGQKCTFTVDAYNGEIFEGSVKSIRLKPITTSNVVTYTVVIHAPNPEEKLFPGMTASISIITKEETALCVPLQALNFEPTFEIFRMLDKPQGIEGEIFPEPSNNEKTVWLKNGNSIRPITIETGLDDGVNAIVKGGNLQPGDTIVLSASVQAKEEKRKQGVSLFGPPPGRRNR
ncbi:MAG: efflux RND transporter periplasmic adaptor subunit [Bacteroidales bacterium]|nr:efflux RND transporter periplasmic adaptor subunit [Bacteroidales bacterium]